MDVKVSKRLANSEILFCRARAARGNGAVLPRTRANPHGVHDPHRRTSPPTPKNRDNRLAHAAPSGAPTVDAVEKTLD